jgi:ATP-binding cassette subfamily B protein
VLCGVDVHTIRGGERIGIAGRTGSGKTTLISALFRMADVQTGTITVDGVDIADVAAASLRAAAAVVPQDAALFNDTLAANIGFGAPSAADADPPLAAVQAAAEAAGLGPALARMPAGLATRVGERGVRLSGGERQRVAVARAVMRNPRLLLCDEATSALDSATEATVLAALARLAAGGACTSVFVAHRLSTVVDCDAIAVLKGGRVVEVGTHADLVARGGVYAAMWAAQARADAAARRSGAERAGVEASV